MFLLTTVARNATVYIRGAEHCAQGLRRLDEENSPKGVSADTVDKLRKMLTFLDAVADPERAAQPSPVEGTRSDGRPQGHMEPECHPQLAADFSDRARRDRRPES